MDISQSMDSLWGEESSLKGAKTLEKINNTSYNLLIKEKIYSNFHNSD